MHNAFDAQSILMFTLFAVLSNLALFPPVTAVLARNRHYVSAKYLRDWSCVVTPFVSLGRNLFLSSLQVRLWSRYDSQRPGHACNVYATVVASLPMTQLTMFWLVYSSFQSPLTILVPTTWHTTIFGLPGRHHTLGGQHSMQLASPISGSTL